MRSRRLVACTLLVVAGASACGGSDVSRTSGSQRSSAPGFTVSTTAVVKVAPVDQDGRLAGGFEVIETVEGASCRLGSSRVSGAESCSAGEFIYDPCWEETGTQAAVVCMTVPWSSDVYRLLVDEGGAGESAEPYEMPWGIELASGLRCLISTGAHSNVGDEVIDYYCGEHEEIVLLRDTLNRSSTVWTIGAAAGSGESYTRTHDQQIVAAWFGVG